MKKKLLSLSLAAAMALSMSVPAFAADDPVTTDNTTGSQDYTVDATIQNASIKVTVPSATVMGSAVKLNPYKLAYTDAMGTEIKEAIYSPVQYMTNLSNTAIGVTAAVKATQGGDVKLLSKSAYDTAMAADATKGAKNTYLYLEMMTVNDNMAAPTWATAYDATKHLAIVEVGGSANGQQKKNIATMEAATDGMAAMEKGMVAFHFAGAVNDKTDDTWAAADKVTLNITFTFTPLSTTTGVTPSADEAVNAGGGAATTYAITEGTHTDANSDITSVAFQVGGSAATTAAENDTVTIEVAATTGKTITASVNGGSAISLSETSGTYTGTFTMPAQAATVVLTVA